MTVEVCASSPPRSSAAHSIWRHPPARRARTCRNPRSCRRSSQDRMRSSAGGARGSPQAIRVARHAPAGRSCMLNPHVRKSSRSSDLRQPVSMRGDRTPSSRSARIPGREVALVVRVASVDDAGRSPAPGDVGDQAEAGELASVAAIPPVRRDRGIAERVEADHLEGKVESIAEKVERRPFRRSHERVVEVDEEGPFGDAALAHGGEKRAVDSPREAHGHAAEGFQQVERLEPCPRLAGGRCRDARAGGVSVAWMRGSHVAASRGSRVDSGCIHRIGGFS